MGLQLVSHWLYNSYFLEIYPAKRQYSDDGAIHYTVMVDMFVLRSILDLHYFLNMGIFFGRIPNGCQLSELL